MQIDEALRLLDAPFDLTAVDDTTAAEMRARLANVGYTEALVCARLGVADMSDILATHLPLYLGVRLDARPLDRLIRLFLLSRPEPADEMRTVLGDTVIDGLLAGRVLSREGDVLRCRYSLFPCLGLCIVTDALITKRYHRRYVMPLGGDSYALARAIFPTPGRVLDVCTGSGVQALVAAVHARAVVAVDVNPRALHFVALNARLNSLPHIETRLGSIYDAVAGERFDHIVANPPFVPTPDASLPLYRGGGESGEDVLHPLLCGLPDHLESGGTAQIYSVMVADGDRPFTEKIEQWLKDIPHGVFISYFSRRTPQEFALNHLIEMEEAWELDSFQRRLQAWIASFERQNFGAITEGVIHAKLLPADAPSWSLERLLKRPTVPYAATVRQFFDNITRLQDEALLQAWKPRISAGVRAIWQGRRGQDDAPLYALTRETSDWNSDLTLTKAQYSVLAACDGQRTVTALREQFDGEVSFDEVLAQIIALDTVQ